MHKVTAFFLRNMQNVNVFFTLFEFTLSDIEMKRKYNAKSLF